MECSTALDALNQGTSPTDVAQAFMAARNTQPVGAFCNDLVDLAEALDSQVGAWTLDPPGRLSTLRVQPEVLSAFSIAWKQARPAGPKWRFELRSVVLILNGKFRTVTGSELEDEVGAELAAVIRQRQPAPPEKVRKGKKVAVVAPIADPVADEVDETHTDTNTQA